MDFSTLLLLVSIILISFLIFKSNSRARNLPPGPSPFPIIGNILQLGSLPHHSLTHLSKQYGPLMSLQLGTQTAIVVSSPEYAKIVLQKHNLVFSSRPVPASMEAIGQENSLVWLPAGTRWRMFRKICKEELFSGPKLQAGLGLRKQKLRELRGYLKECALAGHAVDIGEAAFTTSLNLMSSTFFSREFATYDSGAVQELKEVVCGSLKCIGLPNMADYFPILKKVDPQGISRESKKYFNKLSKVFDEIIDEKMKSKKEKKNDLLDALLEINAREEGGLSIDDIKRLLMDLFVAGTDTSSVMTEWALTELIRKPDQLHRLREEISEVIGKNEEIQESDISRLPYLQAVVKETLRLHPPAPFLVPHTPTDDVEIESYIIPKNSKILVNVWAMGRDFKVWPNADVFMPERFMNDSSHVDFKGKYFELIPFGAGRRTCPGLPLANRMLHLMVAAFVHEFNWKLEEGVKLDMSENFGLTLQKSIPLDAIPILDI